MRKISKLKEVLPIINGLFAHIDYQFWDFEAIELDVIFMSKYSMRSSAPIIDTVRMINDDTDNGIYYLSDAPLNCPLTDSQLATLGTLILKMFKPKWDRLKDLNFLEYNLLYTYLDIYNEVLRDEKSTSTGRIMNNATETAIQSNTESSTSTSSSTENTSNSEMESTRDDTFNGTYQRNSVSDNVRTDNLIEHNAARDNEATSISNNLTNGTVTVESYANQRVDDLVENTASQKEDSQLAAKSKANKVTDDPQRTDRAVNETSESSTENNNSVYGFDSETPSPTDTANGTTGNRGSTVETSIIEEHESANIEKEVGSQQLTSNNAASKTNQGTVSDAGEKTTTATVTNTGGNLTALDKSSTSSKVNEGTQSDSEASTLFDVTANTDQQSSSSTINSGSNIDNSNTSESTIDRNDRQNQLSKLEENSTVAGALSRAKETIHKGNLGNIAPQDLIKKEIELWRWNFIQEVFDDVKSFISLAIYS